MVCFKKTTKEHDTKRPGDKNTQTQIEHTCRLTSVSTLSPTPSLLLFSSPQHSHHPHSLSISLPLTLTLLAPTPLPLLLTFAICFLHSCILLCVCIRSYMYMYSNTLMCAKIVDEQRTEQRRYSTYFLTDIMTVILCSYVLFNLLHFLLNIPLCTS
jgi:hypothetical protein